jgi:hypothetical protein|tara:strand:+ start:7911 stop:9080 length:1170 start_codon:yes stop_codon:yes gene_type:complete
MKPALDISQAPTAAEHAASMAGYMREGERLASALGNRGPVLFDSDGKLHREILDAYWEHGFYIFEGLIKGEEIEDLRAGIDNMLERAPAHRGATVDAKGRPAFGQEFKRNPYLFIKPLSDPWGGTEVLSGRHPTQMTQPIPDESAPEDVVYLMNGMCQAMESGLRLYGHPQLLTIAEAINGADFVPFNDAIFVKQPGLGGSVAWHQDGVTHWESEQWDEGIHGFNFQVQLYPSTLGNCLWVMPGTHKEGRIDIKKLVAKNGGSEQLPGAVPLTCQAGDVTIVNRQALHGSFANTSADIRVSMTFGFHRRSSILGAHGALGQNVDEVYDEQRIFDRSSVIVVAIDARQQHYAEEERYCYQPFAGLEDDYRWGDDIFKRVILDYNLKDLAI